MATGFVYCWTDNKNNMIYIGSHKGSVLDGYICSSKYMLEEYKSRPNDFTRTIIATGNIDDMRTLESKILKSVDAASNNDFYNRHNNDGLFFEGWQRGQMTDSHRANLSKAAKNRIRTQDHIDKLHHGRRGTKNSDEHKAALINSRIGAKHTDSTKNKMREKKLMDPLRFEKASAAGCASVAKRPDNYSDLQSEAAKRGWIKRKQRMMENKN